MPKLDLEAIEQINRTGYPPPYDAPMAKRHYRRIAPATGLSDFGVSHVVLEPGGTPASGIGTAARTSSSSCSTARRCSSRMRARRDARRRLRGFPEGSRRRASAGQSGDRPCTFVAVGKPAISDCHYPDIDMHLDGASGRFTHKDGQPYD